jgi:tight adherence protein C
MNLSVAGALLGLAVGSGIAITVSRIPRLRRLTLADRVAPYLRDSPQPSRLLTDARTITPFPTLERLIRPALRPAVRLLERTLGGTVGVRRRLENAGSELSLEQFRIEQLGWGALGLLGGIALSLLLLAEGRIEQPAVLAVLSLLTGVLGVLARDRALSRQVRRRADRILAEFPTIAELLALSVAAGEGALGAIERVARLGRGELAGELRRAVAEIRAGAPLSHALEGVAARTSPAPVVRFVDGIVIAIDRGTPLADVLRAQAADARESRKRALIEEGGRREIAMMVPVVFMILPLTVIFALFPGFYGLTFTSP